MAHQARRVVGDMARHLAELIDQEIADVQAERRLSGLTHSVERNARSTLEKSATNSVLSVDLGRKF
jgi:hypothetical protein